MATEPHFERDRNDPPHLGSSAAHDTTSLSDGSSFHVANPNPSSQSLGGKVRQSSSASPISFSPILPTSLHTTINYGKPRYMNRSVRKSQHSNLNPAVKPFSARIQPDHTPKPRVKTTYRVSKKRKPKSRPLAYPGIRPSKFPSASSVGKSLLTGSFKISIPFGAKVQ